MSGGQPVGQLLDRGIEHSTPAPERRRDQLDTGIVSPDQPRLQRERRPQLFATACSER